MTVISADVPDELIEQLDETVEWRYESRSQHIRDALRLYLEMENPREMLENPEDTAGIDS